jgi:hypothetical protein
LEYVPGDWEREDGEKTVIEGHSTRQAWNVCCERSENSRRKPRPEYVVISSDVKEN